jgi:mycoredoxin
LEICVTEQVANEQGTTEQVTVYWRPGCGFCSMLRAGLQREGIETHEVNIWEDPEAAAFVRSVARGNETVPTVTVGSVSLVNPTAGEVAALLAGANR